MSARNGSKERRKGEERRGENSWASQLLTGSAQRRKNFKDRRKSQDKFRFASLPEAVFEAVADMGETWEEQHHAKQQQEDEDAEGDSNRGSSR